MPVVTTRLSKFTTIHNQRVNPLTNRENGSIHLKTSSLHLFYIRKENSMPYYVPTVIEKSTEANVHNIYSRLLMDQIIFLGTQIDDQVANAVIAQLLFLQQEDEKDIYMYINSPVVL